jgi:hypothetical protein
MLPRLYRSPCGAALVVVLTSCGLTLGDDTQSNTQGRRKSTAEKASGVITKIEPAGEGKDARRAWRLTVNTDVVWRDFERDQAVSPKKAAETGIAKAAAKGSDSVATKGHPQDKEFLVTVEIDPQTEITMRYRSATDADGEGSATPEGAGKAETAGVGSSEKEPSAKSDREESRRESLKPRKLEPKELKAGLWVDIEFRHKDNKDQARRVTVMRPVGGPDTSPDKEKPSASPTSKASQ